MLTSKFPRVFQAEWPRAIEELCAFPHIEEAAVLSTCNRMELYVVAVSWHRVCALPVNESCNVVDGKTFYHCFVLRREFVKLRSGCHIAVVCHLLK